MFANVSSALPKKLRYLRTTGHNCRQKHNAKRPPSHMVPKALIGLAVVTVKTDGWVTTFRL